MNKWPVACAATGLALAGLTRGRASPALPDPGPLPASVPVPDAEPPDDPSHDQQAYAEMAQLPNVTTRGLFL